MRAMVIGGGGREHALAWRLAQSARIDRVFAAPGNAGTSAESKVGNIAIEASDTHALVDFAVGQSIDLTIVGPEGPLAAGVVDAFETAGLAILGPTQAAARLEGSKQFAKAFMARHRIPTAGYGAFTEAGPAHDYAETLTPPMVIKADGLAAGKGVVIAADTQEARRAIDAMLAGNTVGAAGHRIIIEEYLQGAELSFICLVDGERVVPLASSQDHKRRDDGDRGPNTGGMGAYSPAPIMTQALHDRILREIVEPVVAGMAAESAPYRGFLYAGLMVDAAGNPKVLEFNCRLGDPEAQALLMRLRTDLAELCLATCSGGLEIDALAWDARSALGVVMAAGGYPGRYAKGDPIHGLAATIPETKVFHAGTSKNGKEIVTSGGRVLCATALGDTLSQARDRAYEAVGRIHWRDVFYRRDIGYRAIDR